MTTRNDELLEKVKNHIGESIINLAEIIQDHSEYNQDYQEKLENSLSSLLKIRRDLTS